MPVQVRLQVPSQGGGEFKWRELLYILSAILVNINGTLCSKGQLSQSMFSGTLPVSNISIYLIALIISVYGDVCMAAREIPNFIF